MTKTTAVATSQQSAANMRTFLQTQATDIALIAPAHISASTFIAVATDALSRDELLLQAARANPVKLIAALMKAARYGLEPGTEEFYLTPRKSKGQWEILGIVGYQGIIKMIYNAGAVSSVVVELVRANDTFEYAPGLNDRPIHRIDWVSERGEPVLVYAYAVMKDGATSKVVVLNRTDIDRHRAASDSKDSQFSPWNKWPEAMWMKTAARQLGKWVPTSAEVRTTTGTIIPPTGSVVSEPDFDDGPTVDTETGEITEGEIVDEPSDEPPPEAEPPPSEAQLRKIGAQFGQIGWTDRDDQLRAVAAITQRPDISSRKELSKADASAVIEVLTECLASDDPQIMLTDLIAENTVSA